MKHNKLHGLAMPVHSPSLSQRERRMTAFWNTALTGKYIPGGDTDKPMPGGGTFRFFYVTCTRRDEA